jgi:site-specific DNA recombinase
VITDKHQVALATVTGDVDLSTTQGRLLARAWGAFAAHESEVKSERLKRAFLERARKGKDAWTIRMYGYEKDLRTINVREARVIKEAAKRMLKGESLNSLTLDFNRRKIRTTNGKVWSGSHLRALLRNPRLAGFTKYRGEIVGKGAWPAILRPIDSARLRELFRDRGKQNNSANSPNILAGLLVCGWCGTKMAPSNGSPEVERRRYGCPKLPGRSGCGHVSVMSSYVENSALEMILERVGSTDIAKRPVRTSARDRRWTDAAEELDRAQRLLESMARDLGEGRLSRREWLVIQPPLAERIQKYTAVVMQDRYDTGIRAYIGNPGALEAAWPDMGSSQRRAVLRGLIDHIVVRPATIGQRVFDPTRLTFRWRGDGPFLRPRRMKAPPQPRCGVRGCNELAKCRRLCPMHYRRWQTIGTPGIPGPSPNHWFIGRPCKTPGCKVDSTDMGWCRVHYEHWLEETADRPRCKTADCERPVKVKGVCLRHYNRRKYHVARAVTIANEGLQPNLRTMKPCKAQNCSARTVGKGLCADHYQAWLQATAHLERCAWDGCERPMEVRGMCSKHELRVRYYKGAVVPYRLLTPLAERVDVKTRPSESSSPEPSPLVNNPRKKKRPSADAESLSGRE